MICTCDNCHYTFQAETLPSWCPDCGRERRNHKFASKIISVPCVRPATEDEAVQYEKVIAEERDVADLVEKLKMLGEPYFYKSSYSCDEDDSGEDQTEDQTVTDTETEAEDETETETETETEDDFSPFAYPPDPYNLSVHEHNFALMVIYYVKQMGRFYGKQDLEKMIMGENAEDKVELFKNVKKIFTRGINNEERGIEKPSHVSMEIWRQATPALKTLYAFRQDDSFKLLFGDPPNRGNIKRIDLEKLATEPSEGFMRFLTELYNGIKE